VAGYSATPLAKKLGIKAGSLVAALNAPDGYAALLAPLPPDVSFQKSVTERIDLVHVFVVSRAALASQLARILGKLRQDAAIWVSWPKQSAGVSTDVTENVIRAVALPMGLVDIKVCAVDDIWSGLKLVIRKENRGKA
jgi:predicted lipoprotein